MPYEVVLGFIDHTEEYLAAGPRKQTVLALTAGSFICLGAMLSIVLPLGSRPTAWRAFSSAPACPVGQSMASASLSFRLEEPWIQRQSV